MKNLYQPGVCACLQEPDRGRTTVVLSTLQNIFLEGIEPLGLVQEDIEQFIAARELSRFPLEQRAGSKGVGDRCRIRVSSLRAKARTKGMRCVDEMWTL